VQSQRLAEIERRGDLAGRLREAEELVCECELVTRGQVEAALAASGSTVLNDLRRDLRLGMGPCQAGFCAYRAAGLIANREIPDSDPQSPVSHPGRSQFGDIDSALLQFLQERWKGLRPVMWGGNLRQLELDLNIYRNILGVERLPLAQDVETFPTERTA
jgi:glycerol-3-phosphate dehydrogenase